MRESEKLPRDLEALFSGRGFSQRHGCALLLATVDHRRHMAHLRAEYGSIPYSLAAVVALLIGVLGVLGLVTVLFRA